MAVNPIKTASKAGKHKASPTGAKRAPRAKPSVVIPKSTAVGDSRKLTVGERRMMVPIFKNSIFYDEVKIFNAQYGLYQKGYGVTPNGNLYAPGTVFREDYSKENTDNKIWFMHEMTHVWQWYRGYGIIKNGLPLQAIALSSKAGYNLVYRYDRPEQKDNKFYEFNMEQQAEIIADYYGAKFLGIDISKLPFLEKVLADFLTEPRAVALLPGARQSGNDNILLNINISPYS